MDNKTQKILIGLLVMLIVLSIISTIVMLIWNKIIIKKFPTLLIQEINFFEALAIIIFCHILCKGYNFMTNKPT